MVRTSSPLPILALPLALLPAACAGSPAADASAAAAKPVARARDLTYHLIGPPTLARAGNSLRAAIAGIGDESKRLADLRPATDQLIAIDRDRLPVLATNLRAMSGREFDRVRKLDVGPLADELDPQRFGRDLHDTADRMPRLLWLDRRPMEEHDDYRHRTDPDDLHAETGLWRRILRRLGM